MQFYVIRDHLFLTSTVAIGAVTNSIERLRYPGFGVRVRVRSMILVSNIFVDVCSFTHN
jgi:hypothetical protein